MWNETFMYIFTSYVQLSPPSRRDFVEKDHNLVDFPHIFDNNCSVDLPQSAIINFTCIHYINGEISLVKKGRGPQVAMDAKICACCNSVLT